MRDKGGFMKNVLITGACGGMGSAVVKLLSENGYRVFAIDKKLYDTNNENIISLSADLTDEKNIISAVVLPAWLYESCCRRESRTF